MEVIRENSSLNINPARADKFYLIFGDIPSLSMLAPNELSEINKILITNEDKNFFHLGIKGVTLPGISLDEMNVNTTHMNIKDISMKYNFENLTTSIKLDSNFFIYKMISLWMMLMNNPEGYNQYASLKTFEKTAVNAVLVAKDNFNNPVVSFEFYDLRPISLPSIPLSFDNEGDEIVLDVTWQYTYFMPKKIDGESYNLKIG